MSDFNSSFCFCHSLQSLRNKSLWCMVDFFARPRHVHHLKKMVETTCGKNAMFSKVLILTHLISLLVVVSK